MRRILFFFFLNKKLWNNYCILYTLISTNFLSFIVSIRFTTSWKKKKKKGSDYELALGQRLFQTFIVKSISWIWLLLASPEKSWISREIIEAYFFHVERNIKKNFSLFLVPLNSIGISVLPWHETLWPVWLQRCISTIFHCKIIFVRFLLHNL